MKRISDINLISFMKKCLFQTKYYLIILCVLFIGSSLQVMAQYDRILDEAVSISGDEIARNSISMLPGFSTNPFITFSAYISANAPYSSKTETAPPPTSVIITGIPSSDMNYIRTFNLRAKATLASAVPSNTAHIETVQYFDGLGRPVQQVSVKASPEGHDIIQPVYYDAFGRQSKKYLPYVHDGDGSYQEDATTTLPGSAIAYYNQNPPPDGLDARDIDASITIEFDDSPFNRVEREEGPGFSWKNYDKGVQYEYLTNDVVVPSWYADGSSAPNYPIGSLYVTRITQDGNTPEENIITEEYKDKQGRFIRKHVWDGENNKFLKTKYVYDDFGRLAIVIPPKSGSPNVDLCYYYSYDARGRMITKKVPGADEVRMVYDNRDRLVLTQDGNQLLNNLWSFIRYDQLNRPVMTGEIKLLYWNHINIQNDFAAQTGNISEEYDGLNSGSFGYTLNNYPFGPFSSYNDPDNMEIHTATFYDTYDFIDDMPRLSLSLFGFVDTYPSLDGFSADTLDEPKGLVTGTVSNVLPHNNITLPMRNKLYSVFYYDKFGNVIHTVSDNHLAGRDIITHELAPITYEVLRTQHTHDPNGGSNVKTLEEFEYDHTGRLLSTQHTINDGSAIVTSALRYNELGQLLTKYLHSTDGDKFAQKVDYTYNIRGWLKSINNTEINEDGDLFGMELYYQDAFPGSPGGAPDKLYYNGNISALKWNTAGDENRSYHFEYDNVSRLLEAFNHCESGTDYFSTKYSYDPNGNIKTLQRFFKGVEADDLDYDYENSGSSNRLESITENSPQTAENKLVEIVGPPLSVFSYDDNGNMTYDPTKNSRRGIQYF